MKIDNIMQQKEEDFKRIETEVAEIKKKYQLALNALEDMNKTKGIVKRIRLLPMKTKFKKSLKEYKEIIDLYESAKEKRNKAILTGKIKLIN